MLRHNNKAKKIRYGQKSKNYGSAEISNFLAANGIYLVMIAHLSYSILIHRSPAMSEIALQREYKRDATAYDQLSLIPIAIISTWVSA
jgi:hypothetical protein